MMQRVQTDGEHCRGIITKFSHCREKCLCIFLFGMMRINEKQGVVFFKRRQECGKVSKVK